MLESTQSIPYVSTLLQTVGAKWEVYNNFDKVDSFQKHAILNSKYPELRSQAGYLVNPDEVSGLTLRKSNTYDQLNSTNEELATVVGLLHRHGVDLTTPDLREVGVQVVRVIVPGFQHLMGFHHYRLLGDRRLQEISV